MSLTHENSDKPVDADSFWTALGLFLLVEGFLPFISPRGWRRAAAQIGMLGDGQIRFLGLLVIVAGVLILWV